MAANYPDYSWEPIKVTTSDDYILTLMRVWSQDLLDASKGPVMFQHGAGGSATRWLYGQDTALPIAMAELGHDVYIGNSRGTDFSQMHVTLDPAVDEAEYWDFSFENLADDVVANLKEMNERSGNVKGWYIGSSQGTQSMQVALTKYES